MHPGQDNRIRHPEPYSHNIFPARPSPVSPDSPDSPDRPDRADRPGRPDRPDRPDRPPPAPVSCRDTRSRHIAPAAALSSPNTPPKFGSALAIPPNSEHSAVSEIADWSGERPTTALNRGHSACDRPVVSVQSSPGETGKKVPYVARFTTR